MPPTPYILKFLWPARPAAATRSREARPPAPAAPLPPYSQAPLPSPPEAPTGTDPPPLKLGALHTTPAPSGAAPHGGPTRAPRGPLAFCTKHHYRAARRRGFCPTLRAPVAGTTLMPPRAQPRARALPQNVCAAAPAALVVLESPRDALSMRERDEHIIACNMLLLIRFSAGKPLHRRCAAAPPAVYGRRSPAQALSCRSRIVATRRRRVPAAHLRAQSTKPDLPPFANRARVRDAVGGERSGRDRKSVV